MAPGAKKTRKLATAPKPSSTTKAAPSARETPRTGARVVQVAEPGAWRAETLARMRALIVEAEPAMIEERKWRKASNQMAGVPVWSQNGIVCTGETYAKVVKLTFAHGAKHPDPSRLFNASLEGGTRRAIDIREGEKVDAVAFKKLIKAAVAYNGAGKTKPTAKAPAAKPSTAKASPLKRKP